MESKEFTLPSGATLIVSEAKYVDAVALLKSLARCAEGIKLPENFLDADVSVLKDMLIRAVVSPEVENAIFKCAERALYENQKVEPALFDDPKLRERARPDHFLIQWHIVEVNCGPFFGTTFSALRERLKTNQSIPASAMASMTR